MLDKKLSKKKAIREKSKGTRTKVSIDTAASRCARRGLGHGSQGVVILLQGLDGVKSDHCISTARGQQWPVRVESQAGDGANSLGVQEGCLRPHHPPLLSRSVPQLHYLQQRTPLLFRSKLFQYEHCTWPCESLVRHLAHYLLLLALMSMAHMSVTPDLEKTYGYYKQKQSLRNALDKTMIQAVGVTCVVVALATRGL